MDGKDFYAAMRDYDAALLVVQDPGTLARLHAGKALALEGVSEWDEALRSYDQALAFADRAGASPDPYVINSRGNIYNALGRWSDARENYLISSDLFQVIMAYD